ncbi:MAG: TetR/AcrR family transcriptional regulator [Hyphomicrobiaceae bacterium]
MSNDENKRSGYHHGNLRQALLDAARRLIVEKGPDGFTLAEAARLAGVSPAAPYRHFKDRGELLGTLAVIGFEDFTNALDTAWENGRPDAVTAFTRVGQAYLSFARRDPAAYKAMFEPGLGLEDVAGLRTARSRAFDNLRSCSAALLARAPKGQLPPVDLMSLHIWALTHGVATLFAEGNFGRGRVPMTAEDVLESGVLVYLRGLGVIPSDDT